MYAGRRVKESNGHEDIVLLMLVEGMCRALRSIQRQGPELGLKKLCSWDLKQGSEGVRLCSCRSAALPPSSSLIWILAVGTYSVLLQRVITGKGSLLCSIRINVAVRKQ